MNEEVLIPLTLFIAIAFVIYFGIRSRHMERMLLIEKDVNVEDLKKLYIKSNGKYNKYNTAKWALIFLFGGTGLFFGIWVAEIMREDGYAFASVAISVGIGLLVWQRLYGNKQEDES